VPALYKRPQLRVQRNCKTRFRLVTEGDYLLPLPVNVVPRERRCFGLSESRESNKLNKVCRFIGIMAVESLRPDTFNNFSELLKSWSAPDRFIQLHLFEICPRRTCDDPVSNRHREDVFYAGKVKIA